ncbi:DUF6473 family protein [Alkalilacustris brevis]|uniref:DUF6473 family protein n=1 Tax=Alkalilacustris brevis TaxID=2026338 RepID=UPI000E0CD31D|nr:DUF6473 family protein [Alkalilacustris brevis]
MAYSWPGRGGLDYHCCSYGQSRLRFRGPSRRLEGRYCAVLGGTESFGKFIARPYADLLEQKAGTRVINLGCVNAGLDSFLGDEQALQIARGAEAVVLQLPGAHALSNPLYTVHPRRNDRFLRTAPALRALYPEVDFTEFTFTRHLLGGLARRGPRRFAKVRAVLAAAWVERAAALIAQVGRPVVGLWLARHAPPAIACPFVPGDPLMVTRDMLDRLLPSLAGYVEMVAAAADDGFDVEGMIFAPAEREAAAHLPGPAAHETAAERLMPLIKAMSRPT